MKRPSLSATVFVGAYPGPPLVTNVGSSYRVSETAAPAAGFPDGSKTTPLIVPEPRGIGGWGTGPKSCAPRHRTNDATMNTRGRNRVGDISELASPDVEINS